MVYSLRFSLLHFSSLFVVFFLLCCLFANSLTSALTNELCLVIGSFSLSGSGPSWCALLRLFSVVVPVIFLGGVHVYALWRAIQFLCCTKD